jgi:hypothetical protein
VKRLIGVATLAAILAGTTAGAGWWTVPLVAAVWARVFPHAAVRTCMAAAALSWAALLAWTGLHAPLMLLVRRLADVFQLPPWGLLAVTLLFPALLAGMAARATRPALVR